MKGPTKIPSRTVPGYKTCQGCDYLKANKVYGHTFVDVVSADCTHANGKTVFIPNSLHTPDECPILNQADDHE